MLVNSIPCVGMRIRFHFSMGINYGMLTSWRHQAPHYPPLQGECTGHQWSPLIKMQLCEAWRFLLLAWTNYWIQSGYRWFLPWYSCDVAIIEHLRRNSFVFKITDVVFPIPTTFLMSLSILSSWPLYWCICDGMNNKLPRTLFYRIALIRLSRLIKI